MAESQHVDLIVIGSHGRSTLGRMVLGSVSQTVVTQAHCSVRVARERSVEPHHPLRILVGVDGSAQAQATVQHVASRLWPPGSDVRVVTAIHPSLSTAIALPAVQQWSDQDDVDKDAWVYKFVEEAAERLRATDLSVSTLVQEGDPKNLLLEEAQRWGADCIFVGARGLNQLERLLLGSVSTAVAARAGCSVEVIRPALG